MNKRILFALSCLLLVGITLFTIASTYTSSDSAHRFNGTIYATDSSLSGTATVNIVAAATGFTPSTFASQEDAQRNAFNIVCWGDSLTSGTGGQISYPTQLQSLLLGANIVSQGYGGTDIGTVLTNYFVPKPYTWNYANIIWPAGNYLPTTNDLAAVIAGFVTNLPSPRRYVILGPIGTTSPSDADLYFITNSISYLSSLYGTNFFDIWTFLCQGGANIPAGDRLDSIHLTTAGYAKVAGWLSTNIAIWGGNPVKPVNTLDLGAALATPTPIGDGIPSRGRFSQIVVGDTNPVASFTIRTPMSVWKDPALTNNQVMRFVDPQHTSLENMRMDFGSYSGTTWYPWTSIKSTLASGGGGILTLQTYDSSYIVHDALTIDQSQSVGFPTGFNVGGNFYAYSDGSGEVALRNTTTPHIIDIYNTYTSGTSYERGRIGWSGNCLYVATQKGSGGGSARTLQLGTYDSAIVNIFTANTDRWQVSGTGHFLSQSDGSYDIGAIGSGRPGNVNAATKFTAAGSAGISTSTQVLVAGGTTNLQVHVGGILVSNIVNYYSP